MAKHNFAIRANNLQQLGPRETEKKVLFFFSFLNLASRNKGKKVVIELHTKIRAIWFTAVRYEMNNVVAKTKSRAVRNVKEKQTLLI